MSDDDPFLVEALRRGLITGAQVEDVKRIAAALHDVQLDLALDEIVARRGFLTTSQSAEIRRSLARLRVGRYEVIERLGEGAAGIVWKARDTKLDRVVALKVLSQKAQVSPSFRERFLREARIAVTLNHVNIVRGLDYGEADGYQYFAMEFVDGEDAESRLTRLGRIAERDAVAMALDVVRALEHVQKFAIVHRDIKPSNLMLTPTGHAKLCDLGLAKPMLAETELKAGDGSTAGTPYYMSPEQIREPEKIDWRSDVYSLGATLYHLLTGVPVFRPDAQSAVLQKHLREKPRNPRELVLELSDGVASVVLRMLQKSPDDRYASLAELSGDLEAVLAGKQPLHTAPPVPPEEATAERHARLAVARRITEQNLPRERFPMLQAAAFVMVACAVVVIGMKLRGEPPPQKVPEPPPPAVPAGTLPIPPAPVPAPQQPPAPSPAPSPDTDAALERSAMGAWKEREGQAKGLVEDKHLKAARELIESFRTQFGGTKAAAEADRELVRIDRNAHEHIEELFAKARASVARHRFEEARALVDEAAQFEVDDAERLAGEQRQAIESAARAFERDRESQAAAFADTCGRVLLAVGKDSVATARVILDREKSGIKAYDLEADLLLEDLHVLEKYGVDPDMVDDTNAKGAHALLLVRLARGEVALAERELDVVRSTGGDVDLAKSRIAAVRGVLARQAEDLLARAQMELAANHPDLALRAADEAQRLLPDFAPTTVMLARIRIAQNEFDLAIALLVGTVGRSDAPAEAHLRLGQALARKGDDLARAEHEFRRFLDEAPAEDRLRPEAQTALADTHARRVETSVKRWREQAKAAKTRGKRDVAEGLWGRIVDVVPDDPEALLRLGEIYAEKQLKLPAHVLLARVGKAEKATDAQKKRAAELLAPLQGFGFQSDDGREVAADAEAYFGRDDWVNAIRNFQLALNVSPYLEFARVRLIRALIAEAAGSNTPDYAREAIQQADLLARLYPDDGLPPALRAEAELVLGDRTSALKDAARAVINDPKCAAAQMALGHVHIDGGDAATALAAFRAAHQAEPSAQALLGTARAYLRLADAASAVSVLNELKEKYRMSRSQRDEYNVLMQQALDGK